MDVIPGYTPSALTCLTLSTSDKAELPDEPWECNQCMFPYNFSNSFFDQTSSDIAMIVSQNENEVSDRD